MRCIEPYCKSLSLYDLKRQKFKGFLDQEQYRKMVINVTSIIIFPFANTFFKVLK